MAEAQSIKARIAALNLEEVHAPAPGKKPTYTYDVIAGKKKPPPPPPPVQRHQTVNNPPLVNVGTSATRGLGNQPAAVGTPRISPALPPRVPPRASSTTTTTTSSTITSPALPPRTTPTLPPRKSYDRSTARRESSESISTVASGMSMLSLGSVKTGESSGGGVAYRVMAPAYDAAKLPPLPPKKVEDARKSKATLAAMKSGREGMRPRVLAPVRSDPIPPPRPSLPPRQETKTVERAPERPPLPSRSMTTTNARLSKVAAPLPPRRSILEMGFNNKPATPPPVPQTRPSYTNSSEAGGGTNTITAAAGSPPPVPLSSRPNLDAIMTSKPKPGAVGECLRCRDFSGPDAHAAKFPRTQLPSSDVGWLAHQLCSPFPSATDKARAIFTWLHHNVDYDVHSFFNGTVQPSTPEKTITSGLAVCEGYAGLFAALALKAGLECIVCSGASKGFGHKPLEAHEPVPPFQSTHAWNAVRIDGGEWKLVDPCWGAGNIGCPKQGGGYNRAFNASMFSMDNNDFGYKHFPSNTAHQFRSDGRAMSYDEFQRDDQGGRVMVFGSCSTEHGIGSRTFEPRGLCISTREGPAVVRFQFSAVCAHWDNARHGKGKPYVMLLNVAGRDGRNSQHLPFNTDGRTWWLDVERAELGAPGQKIAVNAVTEFCGKDARGLTYQAWRDKKAYSCQFGGVASWELV